jgi:hypothetical protein
MEKLDSDICPLCFCSTAGKKYIITRCGHIGCIECLSKFIIENHKCSTCEKILKYSEDIVIFNDDEEDIKQTTSTLSSESIESRKKITEMILHNINMLIKSYTEEKIDEMYKIDEMEEQTIGRAVRTIPHDDI